MDLEPTEAGRLDPDNHSSVLYPRRQDCAGPVDSIGLRQGDVGRMATIQMCLAALDRMRGFARVRKDCSSRGWPVDPENSVRLQNQ